MILADALIFCIGKFLEITGVLVIFFGTLTTIILAAKEYITDMHSPTLFQNFRRRLARSILGGLEILVGGDIIRTIAVEPTFTSVGILTIIVLIRTFLSLMLEIETSNELPWQKKSSKY